MCVCFFISAAMSIFGEFGPQVISADIFMFFLSICSLSHSLSLSWDRFRLSADQNGPSSNWYVGPIYKLNTRMNSFKILSIFDDFSFLPKLCAIRLFGQAGLLMSLKLVLFSLFLYVCVCAILCTMKWNAGEDELCWNKHLIRGFLATTIKLPLRWYESKSFRKRNHVDCWMGICSINIYICP